MKSRAFTLIELLIVVAIIAILAAIAVPNFLEAQTRAKNSKALADMRTMTTALETYKIDTGKYPSDAGNGGGSGQNIIYRAYGKKDGHNNPVASYAIGYELTTPISYLSSAEVLIDPYKRGKLDYYKGTGRQGREYYFWFNLALRRENLNSLTSFAWVERVAGQYVLACAGPDGWINNKPGGGEYSHANYIPRTINYDSTNGTVSNGDVYRTQKYTDRIQQLTGVNLD